MPSFKATGEVVAAGTSLAAITNIKHAATGAVVIGDTAGQDYSTVGRLTILWKTHAYIRGQRTLLWTMGRVPLYWYRVVGKAKAGNQCPPFESEACCQRFIINVAARTIGDLCQKLQERRFNWPIERVERFSLPAEAAVISQLEAEGDFLGCNQLQPVEICDVPQCAEFCVYEELLVQAGGSCNAYIVEAFSWVAEGEISVSGNAEAGIPPETADFAFQASDGVVAEGAAVSRPGIYDPQGGVVLGGGHVAISSVWSYVGGVWPEGEGYQHIAGAALSSPTTLSDQPWLLTERVTAADGLTCQADISYGQITERLIARYFQLNVPTDADVLGLRIRINRLATKTGVRDLEVYLVLNDVIISDNLANTVTDWPLVLTVRTYGGNGLDDSTLWRSTPLTPAEVNDPTFGVLLRVQATTSLAATLTRVDSVTAEVFYEYAAKSLIRTGGAGGVSSPYAPQDVFTHTASGSVVIGDSARVRSTDFGQGGVLVAGTASESKNGFFVTASGSVITSGAANTFRSHQGTLSARGGGICTIVETNARFLTDVEVGGVTGLVGLVSRCGCGEIPFTLELTHNIARGNALSQFLLRNGLSLANSLTLNYNLPNDSWQANVHFLGLSPNADAEESWDIVFELKCADDLGGVIIGSTVWKLAVSVLRRNRDTLEDFDTRAVFAVMPAEICKTMASELDFSVSYDVATGEIIVDPSSVVYQTVVFDNIGLFRNYAWTLLPLLTIQVTQSREAITFTSFDLTEPVLG